MISTEQIDTGQKIMDLFTKHQLAELIENGEADYGSSNVAPVVYLHSIDDNRQWLIASINPNNQEEAFGLIDDASGTPKVGNINLIEIKEFIANGTYIFNNIGFYTKDVMSVFVEAAKEAGAIVADLDDEISPDFSSPSL